VVSVEWWESILANRDYISGVTHHAGQSVCVWRCSSIRVVQAEARPDVRTVFEAAMAANTAPAVIRAYVYLHIVAEYNVAP
jgi:hypothetical protein